MDTTTETYRGYRLVIGYSTLVYSATGVSPLNTCTSPQAARELVDWYVEGSVR